MQIKNTVNNTVITLYGDHTYDEHRVLYGIVESTCRTPEANNTVCPLYFNEEKKRIVLNLIYPKVEEYVHVKSISIKIKSTTTNGFCPFALINYLVYKSRRLGKWLTTSVTSSSDMVQREQLDLSYWTIYIDQEWTWQTGAPLYGAHTRDTLCQSVANIYKGNT